MKNPHLISLQSFVRRRNIRGRILYRLGLGLSFGAFVYLFSGSLAP